MKVTGNLTITAENAHEYSELESVSRSLDVFAPFTAPALTKVDVGLYVNANFTAPALTKVGGSLDVYAPFTAPALTKVGGSLCVRAPFNAPALTNIEGEETTKFSYMLGLRYLVLFTDKYIRIGCQRHARNEWATFTDSKIDAMDKMDTDALSFWRKHKDDILNKNT